MTFLNLSNVFYREKRLSQVNLFFVSFYEWYFWCHHVRTHYLTGDDRDFLIFVIFHFVTIAVLEAAKWYCIVVFFFFHLFLLVGGKLLYNTAVVFVIHWHDSHGFTCIVVLMCISLTSWASTLYVLIGQLYIFFGEVSVWVLWPFKKIHILFIFGHGGS